MTQAQKDSVIELFGTVITKSWDDESYKARLVANPEDAIREISPEFANNSGKTIIVRDQTAVDPETFKSITAQQPSTDEHLYLDIPPKAMVDDLALTDEQLEAISGGWTWVPYAVGAALIYDLGKGIVDGFNGN